MEIMTMSPCKGVLRRECRQVPLVLGKCYRQTKTCECLWNLSLKVLSCASS